MAADVHNTLNEWESLNSQGASILSDILALKLQFSHQQTKEEAQGETGNMSQDSDQKKSVRRLTQELDPKCEALHVVIQSMEVIVKKLASLTTKVHSLRSLSRVCQGRPEGDIQPSSQTVDQFGEKDMLLLGILAGTPMNTSEMTQLKPHRKAKHQRQRTTYIFQSRSVCRETFKFIYGISQNKLTALLKHYLEHGLTPRKKKWGGRRFNTNAFSPTDIQRVVDFLHNFAEDYALVLPGRVPGFRKTDVKILPSSQTKAAIWRHYQRLAIARADIFDALHAMYVKELTIKKDLCENVGQEEGQQRLTVYYTTWIHQPYIDSKMMVDTILEWTGR